MRKWKAGIIAEARAVSLGLGIGGSEIVRRCRSGGCVGATCLALPGACGGCVLPKSQTSQPESRLVVVAPTAIGPPIHCHADTLRTSSPALLPPAPIMATASEKLVCAAISILSCAPVGLCLMTCRVWCG